MAPATSFISELTRVRTERGIDKREAAIMFGMTGSEYYDFEAYYDEWFAVLPAHQLRGVIAFLGIDWEACRDWKDGLMLPADKELDAFIAERRQHLGLSREEMADRAGFF
jgi:hypothetical protein